MSKWWGHGVLGRLSVQSPHDAHSTHRHMRRRAAHDDFKGRLRGRDTGEIGVRYRGVPVTAIAHGAGGLVSVAVPDRQLVVVVLVNQLTLEAAATKRLTAVVGACLGVDLSALWADGAF